jgi:anti-anti-sigma regulatory factor
VSSSGTRSILRETNYTGVVGGVIANPERSVETPKPRKMTMRIRAGRNLIVETPVYRVRVVRFARPDSNKYLDPDGEAPHSLLFREVLTGALSDVTEGWTVVVNIGLVEAISAAFYRCLLAIRQHVLASRGRVILCGSTPLHEEVFKLFGASRIFTIVRTESEALDIARAWLSDPEAPEPDVLTATMKRNPARENRLPQHCSYWRPLQS